MRKLRASIVVGLSALATSATPAMAVSPQASCVGQALSMYGPAFGRDLGQQISFEARNPETIGAPTFGAGVSFVAHADRTGCPEEG